MPETKILATRNITSRVACLSFWMSKGQMCSQPLLELTMVISFYFYLFPSVAFLHFFPSSSSPLCSCFSPSLLLLLWVILPFTSACIPSLIPSVKALLSIISTDKGWPAAERALLLPEHATSALESQKAAGTLWEIDVRPCSVAADFSICSSPTLFLALVVFYLLHWFHLESMHNLCSLPCAPFHIHSYLKILLI